MQRQQLLRPYPQYTGVRRLTPAFGNTVYHSLQAKYEKRMAAGVTALVSYTFSKNIGDLDAPQNAYNRSAERAVTDLDVPQRLTIAGAWDLPVGKGRPGDGCQPRARHVDRRLADLHFRTFQSGFALGFGTQGGTFPAGVGGIRPNVIGDPAEGTGGSISSAARPLLQHRGLRAARGFHARQRGRAHRHRCAVPGMNNVNLTLAKDFKIVRAVVMEFRASMFNALNHPVFGGPNTTVGNASFGRISSQANISRQTEFGLRLTY